MANHCAIQVRDAVVTAVSGATDAGTNVEGSRLFNWQTLPAVSVMLGEADYPEEQQTLDGAIFHNQVFELDIYVGEAGDVDLAAFNIAAQATAAVLTDAALLALAPSIGVFAVGVTEPEHTTISETRMVKITALFLVKFVTSESDLTVFL